MLFEMELFLDPWSRALFFQDLKTDYGQCYVALKDAVVVGYVNAWVLCDECTIHRFACCKKNQRSGIGAQLLFFLMHEAVRRGAKTFFLEVRASNAAAQRFYEKAGFVKTGLRKAYYTDLREDAVLMSMPALNVAG
jgi:ribosomal-protein-alanine N-acetyltransferase